MPLQHINDRMLKLMNRRHTRAETEAIIDRLRATIPGLVLRTTFIVGFPGETDAEFEELVEFVEATRFERLGVFTYSFEPDTPAAKLADQLPDELKEARRERIMTIQQPIAEGFNRGLVGRTLDVLIDGRAAGRTTSGSAGRSPMRRRRRRHADPRRRPPGRATSFLARSSKRKVTTSSPVHWPSPRGESARPRARKRPASSLTILDGM